MRRSWSVVSSTSASNRARADQAGAGGTRRRAGTAWVGVDDGHLGVLFGPWRSAHCSPTSCPPSPVGPSAL